MEENKISVNSKEHEAVVVPKKNLIGKFDSDWGPDLVSDSCPRSSEIINECHPQGMASLEVADTPSRRARRVHNVFWG